MLKKKIRKILGQKKTKNKRIGKLGLLFMSSSLFIEV